MYNDLDAIIKTYPKHETINLYAIGDTHVGSAQFNEDAVRKKIQIIKDDPCGVVSLCGDLADYGLRNSVTNVYQQTMPPKAQQEYVYELFKPISDKIVSCTGGNHEERITKEVGTCPMYDLCVLWGIPDVYRENVAILKLVIGKRKNVFIGITTHGASKARHRKFIADWENIDWAISGHVHQPNYAPHGKLRVDRIHGTVSHVPYKEIVVDANLNIGGYGIKKEYEVAPPPELQYLELSAYRDNDKNRNEHRIINYHTIQI